MNADPLPLRLRQPALFELGHIATGVAELFPAVWTAAESLTSPDVDQRHVALSQLQEMGAPRLSPLIAYLIATRLMDPDITFRTRVVYVLGDMLAPDPNGPNIPDLIHLTLKSYLNQMRTRPVYALLEVAEYDEDSHARLARLLNTCPFAGRHLVDILSDRQTPHRLRLHAANFIGVVGFLEAIPALERLVTRLEARLAGQQAMSFAPPSQPNEVDLLPVIHQTLEMLQAP
jgi:HEAT repeat protein